MGYFLKAVFQVAAFLLFQTVLLNLVGQSKYETYIRIFSGFLLILLLFSAIRSFLGGKDLLSEVQSQIEFATEGGNFKQQLRQAEESQKQQLGQEYEKRILQEVERYLESERYFLAEGQVNFSENWELSELTLVISRVWKKQDKESSFWLYDDTTDRMLEGNSEEIQIETIETVEPIEPIKSIKPVETTELEEILEEEIQEEQPENRPEEPLKGQPEEQLEEQTELLKLRKQLSRYLGIEEERIVLIWKEDGT